jgi:DNA-binding response OmpR family regulator
MSPKSNILIIDDEEAIRDSCRQVLEKEGHSVRTARDGEEGLRLFKEEFFHVIYLDLKLPGLDGMELLRLFCPSLSVPQSCVSSLKRLWTTEKCISKISHCARS